MDTLKCPNLTSLFDRIKPFVGEDGVNLLPDPHPRSSLATDGLPLQGKWLNTLIATSFSAGVGEVYTLQRTIIELQFVDTHAPYALLRGALESFTHMVWLLDGPTRNERRLRALRTWAHDFNERNKYEREIGHVPKPPAKSGSDREKEVIDLAVSLGFSEQQVKARPTITGVIREAAEGAGHPSGEPLAAWRVASGFAHGRVWPNLFASEASAATLIQGGALVRLVIDDEKLDDIAKWCDRFLERAVARYSARIQVY